VAELGIEAGGFGVEDQVAHQGSEVRNQSRRASASGARYRWYGINPSLFTSRRIECRCLRTVSATKKRFGNYSGAQSATHHHRSATARPK
jgi:hypothetical protein